MSENAPRETSLYDFFYINKEKICSYLSQLENAGLLQSIKHTSGKQSNEGAEASVGLKGLVGVSTRDSDQFSEGIEKIFDFSQAVPLSAIEALHTNGYINTDIENANYGQIVLLTGTIKLFDLSVFSTIWDDLMKEHIKQENIRNNVKPKDKSLPFEYKIASKILGAMPSFISLKTTSMAENYTAWSTLEHQYVVGNSFDFSLKHSHSIQGKWHVLGVLDAKPYDDAEYNSETDDMLDHFSVMMQAVRELAGRKEGEYGVTPIAIWRKVE